MSILLKIKGAAINAVKKVALFFTVIRPNERQALTNLDLAEIFLALLPAGIFGCLLFGKRAIITLALCAAVCLLVAFLWDVIFNRKNLKIDFKSALMGYILGLTITSGVKLPYIIVISVMTTIISKAFFRNNPLSLVFPVLIAKVFFSVFFFKAFSAFPLPFENVTTEMTPIMYLFESYPPDFAAKNLFFGLHSGYIGQTSECLIIVGAIYLMLRKFINPIICGFFLATSAFLSIIFKQDLALSLLGGGLFFTALFLTMDYCLMPNAIYKKILYGITCGILTFSIRPMLGGEGALLAVLICNVAFSIVTRRNIKRLIKFFKHPNFRRLFEKLWQIVLKAFKIKKSER